MKHRLCFLLFALLTLITSAQAATIRIKASKRYLNLPVSHAVQREIMTIEADGMTVRSFEIRLAPENTTIGCFAISRHSRRRYSALLFPLRVRGYHIFFNPIRSRDRTVSITNSTGHSIISQAGVAGTTTPTGWYITMGNIICFTSTIPTKENGGICTGAMPSVTI